MIAQIRGFTEIFHGNINRTYKKHNIKYISRNGDRESRISCQLSRRKAQTSNVISSTLCAQKISRQCSRTLNDIVENTMRRKRLILLHSDKSDATACRGASDFIGFISRAVESLV